MRVRVLVGLLFICIVITPQHVSAATESFDFTGTEQTWVVPSGVTSIDVDVGGAQGGGGVEGIPTEFGGKGGRVQTTLAVTPGETLYIYVGGYGGDLVPPNTAGAGGFNGGGPGGIDNVDANGPAGGGGGASDIRQGGNTPDKRVVVGGGGGGGECCQDGSGGDGGGITGSSGGGSAPGGGGTQTNGGSGGGNGASGSAGQGGGGGNGNRAGGGGGAGWYGGGGGTGGFLGSGGGGGSSYPPGATHAQGFQSGDGHVSITFTSITSIDLICRPLASDPEDSIRVTSKTGRHCYFLTTNSNGTHHTYGAYADRLLTPAKDGDPFSPPNGCGPGGLVGVFQSVCTAVVPPPGLTLEQIVAYLETAVAAPPQGPYHILSNNSNVWCQHRITDLGLDLDLPIGAVSSPTTAAVSFASVTARALTSCLVSNFLIKNIGCILLGVCE
ncbi:MAG: hypothetical protein HYR72_03650 [Deltaproteobacteria bacterium]|nr:hypothetical protein [Deltaproteobacteria bacterium]MBI3388717.1 hypothetical protein [Deltaproteobacteria bacterium]